MGQQNETQDVDADMAVVDHLRAEAERQQMVGDRAASAMLSEKRLGARIKALRASNGIGLVELGRQTNLSASFLSQLETGRVVPTLRNLARIALVFSKDLGYFFAPEKESLFRIHRKGERVRLPQTGVDDPSYFFESLAHTVPNRRLDPFLLELLPRVVPEKSHTHSGCEFVYVLEGELQIRHGDDRHQLRTGDSAYFDSETAHSYICLSTIRAKAIVVTAQATTAICQSEPVTRKKFLPNASTKRKPVLIANRSTRPMK